jgi:hypothetical protein
MEERTYLDAARSEFRRLRRLADAALSQLDDAGIFVQAPSDGNSAAILMKHMSGNMMSRWRDFLTTDGEKPDRDRDSEFILTEADDRAALSRRWEEGWRCLFDALGSIRDPDLVRTILIRREPHTVLQAINRQLTHCAYHTGQIVLLAKSVRGRHWQTLSVAKGESNAFNREPRPYLDEDIL